MLAFRYAFFFGRDKWVTAGAQGVAYNPGVGVAGEIQEDPICPGLGKEKDNEVLV